MTCVAKRCNISFDYRYFSKSLATWSQNIACCFKLFKRPKNATDLWMKHGEYLNRQILDQGICKWHWQLFNWKWALRTMIVFVGYQNTRLGMVRYSWFIVISGSRVKISGVLFQVCCTSVLKFVFVFQAELGLWLPLCVCVCDMNMYYTDTCLVAVRHKYNVVELMLVDASFVMMKHIWNIH